MIYWCILVSISQNVKHLEQVLRVLRNERLYGNLEKCHFFSSQVVFLGFIVSSEGLKADEKKVQAIKE